MKPPLYFFGQQVWPSQEKANKSGEIEKGYIVGVHPTKDGYLYDVLYTDDFIDNDVPETSLSATRPYPPNPNELLKGIV